MSKISNNIEVDRLDFNPPIICENELQIKNICIREPKVKEVIEVQPLFVPEEENKTFQYEIALLSKVCTFNDGDKNYNDLKIKENLIRELPISDYQKLQGRLLGFMRKTEENSMK